MKRRESLGLDLTPVIDVIFILLIFFIVTSVFKKEELALILDLPTSSAKEMKIDDEQIQLLIKNSNLTAEQKADIVGWKIVRGDRGTNKSIVAKGILRNVNSYKRAEQTYLYPNYPYNDLTEDPFLNSNNNAFSDECDEYNINVKQLNAK